MAGTSTTTSEEAVQEEKITIPVVVVPKLKGFWERSISMMVAVLLVIGSMMAGGAFIYYKTATKKVCHTRHIIGFIPDGRACKTEHRY